MTFEEWANCSAVLVAATGRKMPVSQLETFYDLLRDLDYAAVKVACKRALQESDSTFFPAVGLLRRLAVEATTGAVPLAGEEWNRVLTAVRRYGYMQPAQGLATLPPLTQQAVRAVGGWQVLCDTSEPTVIAGQFRMAYDSLASRATRLRVISEDVRPRIGGTLARVGVAGEA